MRTPRPMGSERGWLRQCEFSSSVVRCVGCTVRRMQHLCKMVVLRDRGSLRDHALVPHARHFTKSQQYPESHTRAYHHAAISSFSFFTCATFSEYQDTHARKWLPRRNFLSLADVMVLLADAAETFQYSRQKNIKCKNGWISDIVS